MKLALAIALLCSTGFAADAPRLLLPAKITSVHDGDTYTADVEIPYPWNLTIRDQDIRLQGADAWEVTRTRRTVTITDAEIAKGIKARDELKVLFKTADAVYVEPTENRDPYGRSPLRVHVWKDGKLTEVADWLKANGHVRTK